MVPSSHILVLPKVKEGMVGCISRTDPFQVGLRLSTNPPLIELNFRLAYHHYKFAKVAKFE